MSAQFLQQGRRFVRSRHSFGCVQMREDGYDRIPHDGARVDFLEKQAGTFVLEILTSQ
jgi:hypothetical protein